MVKIRLLLEASPLRAMMDGAISRTDVLEPGITAIAAARRSGKERPGRRETDVMRRETKQRSAAAGQSRSALVRNE